jgi:hypothetical protein
MTTWTFWKWLYGHLKDWRKNDPGHNDPKYIIFLHKRLDIIVSILKGWLRALERQFRNWELSSDWDTRHNPEFYILIAKYLLCRVSLSSHQVSQNSHSGILNMSSYGFAKKSFDSACEAQTVKFVFSRYFEIGKCKFRERGSLYS